MEDFGDSLGGELQLKINNDYAAKYDKWRAKEEYQKLKDKYGDINLDDPSDASSSSTSDEDEDAEALTPEVEKNFLRTLAALKSRDPRIYDEHIKFFDEEGKSQQLKKQREKDGKKAKPMFLKDYEREVIVERGGKFSDDSGSDVELEDLRMPANYFEEQDEIRKSFKVVAGDSGSEEDDSNLLTVRIKSDAEKAKEEEDYLEWLKGQKQELSNDKDIAIELNPLRKFWTDPKLDEGERFLRDYLLNKQYLEEDEDRIPSYEEIIRELEDDEKELDKEEEFEKKYNFRFEEPDSEFIKSYPRVIPETLRNRDTRRIKARQEVRERKLTEKEKKREELKRLKNLKKREIMEKIEKLQEVSGNVAAGFTEDDVEGEFDEDQYDKMMKKVFDAAYYGQEADQEKPVFTDDEDDDVEDWDNWTRPENGGGEDDHLQSKDAADEVHCEDPDFNMDADYDPSQKRVKLKKKKGKHAAVQEEVGSKRKRKSKFTVALERPKPVFNASEKSFEQYFDEYYGLDYEDVVGDLPVRFKYRKVVPNDFGLSVDEILAVPDKELNAWVSVKKMSQYRPEDEELRDVAVFRRKGHSQHKKLNVLSSLRQPDPEEDTGANQPVFGKKQKAKDHLERPRLQQAGTKEEPLEGQQRKRKHTTQDAVDNTSCDGTASKRLKHNPVDDRQSKGVSDAKDANKKMKKKKGKKCKDASVETVTDGDEKSPVSDVTERLLEGGKKSKNKKHRQNGPESTKMDTGKEPCVSDIASEQTVKVVSTQKKKKKNKKKHQKLPQISDERLKAYGINPKKFKYFHSKKLLQNINTT